MLADIAVCELPLYLCLLCRAIGENFYQDALSDIYQFVRHARALPTACTAPPLISCLWCLTGYISRAAELGPNILSWINQFSRMRQLEVQKPAISYDVKFAATLYDAPLRRQMMRSTRLQVRSLVDDVIAALEIIIMPDKDLVLLGNAFGRDIPDFDYPSSPDRPYRSHSGQSDLDIATAARK